ncbi:MAG: hypothetical protein HQK52_12325 [Oligoflexia bacterium]|nr:hypothetical protein [Oligoflexia bacterium]
MIGRIFLRIGGVILLALLLEITGHAQSWGAEENQGELPSLNWERPSDAAIMSKRRTSRFLRNMDVLCARYFKQQGFEIKSSKKDADSESTLMKALTGEVNNLNQRIEEQKVKHMRGGVFEQLKDAIKYYKAAMVAKDKTKKELQVRSTESVSEKLKSMILRYEQERERYKQLYNDCSKQQSLEFARDEEFLLLLWLKQHWFSMMNYLENKNFATRFLVKGADLAMAWSGNEAKLQAMVLKLKEMMLERKNFSQIIQGFAVDSASKMVLGEEHTEKIKKFIRALGVQKGSAVSGLVEPYNKLDPGTQKVLFNYIDLMFEQLQEALGAKEIMRDVSRCIRGVNPKPCSSLKDSKLQRAIEGLNPRSDLQFAMLAKECGEEQLAALCWTQAKSANGFMSPMDHPFLLKRK